VNIGSTVYTAIARYAEGGSRVTKVTLPPALYAEWIDEGLNYDVLFVRLKVEVVSGDVASPQFEMGKEK
jgi:hypothetical protein